MAMAELGKLSGLTWFKFNGKCFNRYDYKKYLIHEQTLLNNAI